jgi:choice-of-anchor B domain-containing protein
LRKEGVRTIAIINLISRRGATARGMYGYRVVVAMFVTCALASGITSEAGIPFTNTGGNSCAQTTILSVPVGPPGAPLSIATVGDTSLADGLDCDGASIKNWWEAFEIDRCARVTIDFCGSPRKWGSLVSGMVTTTCKDSGLTCGPFIQADTETFDLCTERNPTFIFDSLAPGTYYNPVIVSNDPAALGAYQLRITAEECDGACSGCLGACCTLRNRTCVDGTPPESCVEEGQHWTVRKPCAEAVCALDAANVTFLSQVALHEFPGGSFGVNDVWGYTAPSGREYAIIGLTRGTGFVDITYPQDPVVIADIPDSPSTWSDMATYQHYAFNVNERADGMQIFDLSEIDDGTVTLIGAMTQNGFTDAHNVFVNSDSGYAYLCGSNAPTNGLVIVDVRDPTAPNTVGIWDEFYVHDVYVTSYEDCPYAGRSGACEIAFAFAGSFGLKIIDVTNKPATQTIASLDYENKGYCHQGWLSEDRRTLFFGDESDETRFALPTTTHVVNVEDVANPVYLGTFTNGLPSIDHNLMVRGDLIVAANYTSGLRVFDATDLGAIHEVGHLDTFPDSDAIGFEGAWGVFSDFPSGLVVVSSRQESESDADVHSGLFIAYPCLNDGRSPGDFDRNGRVDLKDFARLQRCYESSPAEASCLAADTDCDLDIDRDDFTAFSTSLLGQQ